MVFCRGHLLGSLCPKTQRRDNVCNGIGKCLGLVNAVGLINTKWFTLTTSKLYTCSGSGSGRVAICMHLMCGLCMQLMYIFEI